MKNKVTNRTNTNKTKIKKLSETFILPSHNICYPKETKPFLKHLLSLKQTKYTTEQILYKVGCFLLNSELEEYKEFKSDISLTYPSSLKKEHDILGTIYQYLTPKNKRLDLGSFYTNQSMIEKIIENEDIKDTDKVFDPSCGSGNLLFTSKITKPEQVYGVDIDSIAIMCCKFNYYIKFGLNAPKPNIFCMDYFDFITTHNIDFDYIINNPPFGATLDVSKLKDITVYTEDSLTFFVEHCSLKSKKKSIFILPESVLNVKKHTNLRKWLLDNVNLSKIISFGANFSGTLFPIISMEIDNINHSTFIQYDDKLVDKNVFVKLPYNYIRPISNENQNFINKIFSKKAQDLSSSTFCLGVVTGDNNTKVFDEPGENLEIAITGKNIEKYVVTGDFKYINKDLSLYQQVAKEELYRTKEKIIYKVISTTLNCAIDYEGRLTLNSANFFIPKNVTLTNKCIVTLLNSEIYNKLNTLLFGENKVSKTNLQYFPLPKFDENLTTQIETNFDNKNYDKNEELLKEFFEI